MYFDPRRSDLCTGTTGETSVPPIIIIFPIKKNTNLVDRVDLPKEIHFPVKFSSGTSSELLNFLCFAFLTHHHLASIGKIPLSAFFRMWASVP